MHIAGGCRYAAKGDSDTDSKRYYRGKLSDTRKLNEKSGLHTKEKKARPSKLAGTALGKFMPIRMHFDDSRIHGVLNFKFYVGTRCHRL